MTPVVVSDRARIDLDDLIDWLADRSPNAAIRASDKLFHAIGLLEDHPRLAREIAGGLRDLVVSFGHFGFVVRYAVTEDAVVIQRVFHGAQDR